MKFGWLLLPFLITAVLAGDKGPYNPNANAADEIQAAMTKAKANNQHVLLQFGGNWCSWCIKLERLYKSNADVQKVLTDNFQLVHVNYSKENKNKAILARYNNPDRLGFPVLVILDADGNLLHTQDSGKLEKGKAHDPEKVIHFLNQWAPKD